jgi:hypothetical protein
MLRTVIECTQHGQAGRAVEGDAFRHGRRRLRYADPRGCDTASCQTAAVVPDGAHAADTVGGECSAGDRVTGKQGDDGALMNTYAGTIMATPSTWSPA